MQHRPFSGPRAANVAATNLARSYVLHGARGGIPEAVSNVSRQVVQALCHQIHGRRPDGGPIPTRITSWLRRHSEMRIPAQKFINIHHRGVGDQLFNNLDPYALLESYEAYRSLSVHDDHIIELTHAWSLTLDIAQNLEVQVRKCKSCGSLHAWSITKAQSDCWICEDIKQKTKNLFLEH